MPWSAVTVDALRVGHYVHLDHPWFVHPFARNEFRIATQREIDIIRRKRLTRLRIDPERSEFARQELPKPADVAAKAAASRKAAANATSDPVALAREKLGRQASAAALQQDLKLLAERRRETVRECGEAIASLVQREPQARERVQELAGKLLDSSQRGDAPLALSRADNPLNPLQRQASHAVQSGSIAVAASARLSLSDDDRRLLTTAALLHGTDGAAALPVRIEPRATADMDWHRLRRILAHAAGKRVPNRHATHDVAGSADPIAEVLTAIGAYQALMEHSRSPARVLAHLYRSRRGDLGAQALQALAAALTVYPPGSCVELSDLRIGVVVRINGRERLRPVLRLFDPESTRPGGNWFDLSTERDVSITRALHPEELDPESREYLGLDVPSVPALWFGARSSGESATDLDSA